MPDKVIIHYSEVAVKGKNRDFFERKLVENISRALGGEARVKRMFGRIVCRISGKSSDKQLKDILGSIPGIASFAFGEESRLSIGDIEKVSLKLLKGKEFESFRVTAIRSNKRFEYDSQQVSNRLGDSVRKKLKKKVNLKNPDLNLRVEICEKEAFIYYLKFKGIGGLPVGTSAKTVVSLSGGIDSPVTAYLMNKRGSEVILVHFFNQTAAGGKVLDKVESIAKEIAKFQLKVSLYIVPFGDIQKQIILNSPSKVRMIIYRRFMMRIANLIAKKEKALGIATGDSLGQVASQTMENLNCIYEASELPVFTPLIGYNKEEIVNMARRIGTYKHSIIPYPDCCSFMVAKHPETRGDLKKIERIEKEMEIDKVVKNSLKKADIKKN